MEIYFLNHGQNIDDKITKLSKIGVSLECFTADFFLFYSTTVKTLLFGGRLGPSTYFKLFKDFLKIS